MAEVPIPGAALQRLREEFPELVPGITPEVDARVDALIASSVRVQRSEWVLAEQPGRHVTHVRDDDGDLWVRDIRGKDPADDRWLLNGDEDSAGRWSEVTVDYGPLTDATPGGGS